MSTYWLTGQEDYRRKNFKKSGTIQTPDVLKPVTRSSLKHSKFSKFNTNRRLSLESQKKIRFASTKSKNLLQINSPAYNDKSNSIVELGNEDNAQCLPATSASSTCLMSKQNSCPCLKDDCGACENSQRELVPSDTPRLCVDKSPLNKLSLAEISDKHFKHYNGWRRLSKFSSFVSCLGLGDVNNAFYDKLIQRGNEVNHLPIIGHSESEPFLPHLCFNQQGTVKDESV